MDEIIEKLRDKSVYKDSMSPLIKKDIEALMTAYSAKPAQPFQWNGALFRFNLNVVQID